MATYLELKAQAEKILEQAEAVRLAELEVVLEEIRTRVAEYGLTPDQIFGRRRTNSKTAKAAPSIAKYQDPKTGATWSGRGREPSWIKGKKRERFLIVS